MESNPQTSEGFKEYHGESLEGQVLVIDYHKFVKCKINNCKLIYGGGPYHISGCTISNSQFILRDAALRTSQFMKAVFREAPGVDDRGNITL